MSGESRRSVAVELLIWIFDAGKKNRANNMAQMPYLVESLNTFAGLLNQHNSLSWWFILQWLTLLFLFFYCKLFLCNCHTLYISYLHPVNSKFSTWHYANFGARLYLIFWCGRTELKKLKMKWLTNLRSCFPSLTLCLLCPQINNSVAFCYR